MAIDRKRFFDRVRVGILGPKLDEGEVKGCDAILDATVGWKTSWIAYALATAYHETAHTMQPIKEYGGEKYFNRMYGVEGQNPARARRHGNVKPGDGARYAGRGFVQLTWRNNYAAMGNLIGVNLVANPDLAMNTDIAARILREGMSKGTFTGIKLADCLPDEIGKVDQFMRARRIINGNDKALQIAQYALKFQEALV
jgi:putative chitinase